MMNSCLTNEVVKHETKVYRDVHSQGLGKSCWVRMYTDTVDPNKFFHPME